MFFGVPLKLGSKLGYERKTFYKTWFVSFTGVAIWFSVLTTPVWTMWRIPKLLKYSSTPLAPCRYPLSPGRELLCNRRSCDDCCFMIWAAAQQNQQNDMCTQRRLRSAWHLPSLIRVFTVRIIGNYKDPMFLHADSEDWSDWADAQADLSLCWAHRSFCCFCHAVAHLCFSDTDKVGIWW